MKKVANGAVLILGVSSSLGISLSNRMAQAGSEIYGTARAAGASCLDDNPKTRLLELDLSSDQSCLSFVDSTAEVNYETVILLIGSLYIPWSKNLGQLATVKNYFEVFVSRYLWVIDQIITNASTPNLRILNLSSRAAMFGSFDHYYSAAKAAMDLYLRSKCRTAGGNLQVLSVAPGLIEGSGMASHFKPHLLQNHRERAGSQLLTVDSATDELLLLLDSPLEIWDGRTTTIGPVYN